MCAICAILGFVDTCRASILTGKLDFNKKCWDGVSSGAKDFVRSLLTRDPAKRPTAKQALHHPWIRGRVAERSIGQPLGRSVIQRIQVLAPMPPSCVPRSVALGSTSCSLHDVQIHYIGMDACCLAAWVSLKDMSCALSVGEASC